MELWYNIILIISDQCKTNKGLAVEVASKLGVTHQPGQIYCNIHPILMFDEKVKKMWQNLQKKIGAEKLFPSISYSNLDQNTFTVALQCLDALMRFISPTFSHKAWSRHFQFNKFLEAKANCSFALKDHRFGQLATVCLIGLLHFNDVIEFLDSDPNCWNQLACMIRGMADLEDFLKFSWAATGLLSIHL